MYIILWHSPHSLKGREIWTFTKRIKTTGINRDKRFQKNRTAYTLFTTKGMKEFWQS